MTTWVLFADPGSSAFRPLTWLRPVSELLLGAERLEERWRRLLPGESVSVVVPDYLAPLAPGRLGWSEAGQLGGSDAIWVRDRVVPSAGIVAGLRDLAPGTTARVGATAAAFRGPALLPVGSADAAESALLAALESAPQRSAPLPGEILGGLGDLVRLQAGLLGEDLARLLAARGRGLDGVRSAAIGDGFAYAPERVWVDATTRIDHGAVLDARDGDIVLGPGSVVLAGTYLKGPLWAAERCLFLGGTIGSGSTFGPVSRVRGEIETTVFLGWANKAHDGFLGHSYVGPWVNLGALTTTSDLKNDYGEVTLEVAGRKLPTGTNKIGAFFGDHAKTRIGCLLNTGTIVGLGANVFGSAAVPEREILDFQWGTGDGAAAYRIDKFLAVARTVLGRRGVDWAPAYEAALRSVHAASHPLRAGRLADA